MKQTKTFLSVFVLSTLTVLSSFCVTAQVETIKVTLGSPDSVGFEEKDSKKAGFSVGELVIEGDFLPTWPITPGLSTGDVDGDGLADVFLPGIDRPSVVYLNQGDWTFKPSPTFDSGTNTFHASLMSDTDGDGDLDLFAFSLYHKSSYYKNDGKGNFTHQPDFPWVMRDTAGDTGGAMADIDGDGDLDLYVTTYINDPVNPDTAPVTYNEIVTPVLEAKKKGIEPSKEFLEFFTIEEGPDGEYSVTQNGAQDVFYMNNGDGTFSTLKPGQTRFLKGDGSPTEMPRDWGLSAIFKDVDQDGDPDLYVCNDFQTPDRYWINLGKGLFRYAPQPTQRRTAFFCMGADFADINRDGHLDFVTLDMLSREHTRRKTQMGNMTSTPDTIGKIFNRPQIMQNTLFLSRGDGTYSEIAQYANIRASEWSWAATFMDVDLDGYEDLMVTTGMSRDYMDSDMSAKLAELPPEKINNDTMNELFPTLKTGNFIFRNNQKIQFDDMSRQWGFKREDVSGGMALADFDNDGDLDVIIQNERSVPELYENKTSKPRILVRLKGAGKNSHGIGSQLRLTGGPVQQMQEISMGGTYASSSDPIRCFAATKGAAHKLDISWADGTHTSLTNLQANHIYTVSHGTKSQAPVKPNEYDWSDFFVPEKAMFKDLSGLLENIHTEAPFDDFQRQSLLPNRMSQLGPGLAWVDLDRDGDDDLVTGSGRGGQIHLFTNVGGEQFLKKSSPQLHHDQTSFVTFPGPQGQAMIMTGLSNYENAPDDLSSAQSFSGSPESLWQFGPGLPASKSMTGPMSMADVDGDGDLDLFVGGRTIPGEYPKPASSRLFLQHSGEFQEHTQSSEVFKDVGLVSGSVFGDLDKDGDPDLVLAVEWGPVMVFENDQGTFKDTTSERGLSNFPGWWNSVQLGDFDNDGQLDIAAGNWGLNSKYEHSYSVFKPLQIHYGDFDDNNVLDIVEAHFDKKMGVLVPERGRSCSSRAMPFIAERNPTFKTFGSGSLEDVYGACIKTAKVVEANTLSHMVFLNKGDKFKGTSLPLWSQFAPVFGLNVADFDGDGNDDLFAAQNFFSVQVETPRMDGGRGLLMLGDGKGGFRSVKAHHSGLEIYGEQRGSAVSDFDKDGRVDLVVSQNGNYTRLFKNETAKPGIRVSLKGLGRNPHAVGAVVQLEFSDGSRGPARSISSGSGYWSQDSSTLVMGRGGIITKLHVVWPGGKTVAYPIRNDLREVEISQKTEASLN